MFSVSSDAESYMKEEKIQTTRQTFKHFKSYRPFAPNFSTIKSPETYSRIFLTIP
jgi:hypothetical protein